MWGRVDDLLIPVAICEIGNHACDNSQDLDPVFE